MAPTLSKFQKLGLALTFYSLTLNTGKKKPPPRVQEKRSDFEGEQSDCDQSTMEESRLKANNERKSLEQRIYDDDRTTELWPKKRVVQLISAIKNRPVVWKKHAKTNAYFTERRKAIRDIAKELNTTSGEVKRKYLSLEGTFRRRYSESLNGKETQWQYYKLLSFLKERYTDTNIETELFEGDDDDSSDSALSESIEVKTHEWSQNATLNLIEFIRINPLLWNPSHRKYYDRGAKEKIFKNIAHMFDVPIMEIKRKWMILRAGYLRELKKISEHSRTKKVSWFAFDALHFLNGIKNAVKSNQNEQSEGDANEDSLNEWLEKDPFEDISSDVDDSDLSSVQISKTRNFSDRNSNLRKRKFQKTNHYHDERDEFTVFGEHVSCKLRKINSERSLNNVQQIINTILLEASFGKFDKYESVRNIKLELNTEN